jgi:hypothetical protein
MGMKRTLAFAITVLVAACGGDAGGATTTSIPPASTSTSAVATTMPEPSTTTTAPAVTTTTGPATTTTVGASPTTLAGQPVELGPVEGDVLMVIGVRHDDTLNLRAGPGTNQPVRDEIPPTYMGLIAEGNTRQLPRSFWIEVDFEGTTGWINVAFVGYEGDVTDRTAAVIAELGETPTAATMTGLGREVAEVFASDAPDPESDIVQVTPVSEGDLAEVTFDVVGFPDDSVRGVRVHVFAEPVAGGFALRSVEVTAICGRGVDSDRICV